MTNTIDYKDGYLCVRIENPLWSEPLQITRWYPFTKDARREFEHLAGHPAVDERDGWYSIGGRIGSYGPVRLHMPDGGNTLPVAEELTPIPCPKVRAGLITRYEDGAWQKRMKSGWVNL